MPTKPLESILYREFSKVAAKDIIKVAAPLLQELVNYATNVLARCADSATGGIDEDLAPLALFRHMIEATDGIEVLLSQACANPAIPLLRSSFEALLSVEYILEQDYTRRSLCWLVGYIHQRLEMYERLDPATERGAISKRLLEADKIAFDIALPPLEETQRARGNLQSLLEQPHLKPIEAEFSKFKRPKWFGLFGGPGSLFRLAERLNRGAQYEFLYRYWSRVAHGEDLLGLLDRTANGEQAIAPLRNPGEIQEVARFAASFMLNATRLVIGRFRPGEDLSRWYKTEVRERYLAVVGKQ